MKIWNNYNELRELWEQYHIRQWLLDNYDNLREIWASVKTVVSEIKEELILILNKKDDE